MTSSFNPLDVSSLAESISRAASESPLKPMSSIETFNGAGIYQIYYQGDFPCYERISHKDIPIYVGKAEPQGSRKGQIVGSSLSSKSLYSRLRKHARSLASASNIEVSDFHARWLVVESIWIPLGESALIKQNSPVWNSVVDGFGLNAPGRARTESTRSLWDTLHPGRPWAEALTDRPETPEHIEQAVLAHWKTNSR